MINDIVIGKREFYVYNNKVELGTIIDIDKSSEAGLITLKPLDSHDVNLVSSNDLFRWRDDAELEAIKRRRVERRRVTRMFLQMA